MAEVGAAMAVGGALLGYEGQKQAGEAAAETGRRRQVESEYEAQQLEQQAGQAVASGQRTAREERRRGDLTESRALALAAAGGGGVSDPTMTNIFGDIQGESAYRSAVAMYEGEEEARQLRMGAESKRYSGETAAYSGEQQQYAYNLGALGSLTGGASSLFSKYGGGGSDMTGEERYGSDYDAYNYAGY